jgi:hypothetical protein
METEKSSSTPPAQKPSTKLTICAPTGTRCRAMAFSQGTTRMTDDDASYAAVDDLFDRMFGGSHQCHRRTRQAGYGWIGGGGVGLVRAGREWYSGSRAIDIGRRE